MTRPYASTAFDEPPVPTLDAAATATLLDEIRKIETDESRSLFERCQAIARYLGAHYDPDTGLTRFGFWAPEFSTARIEDNAVTLELFSPLEPVLFARHRHATTMQRTRLSIETEGDYWWGVVAGVVPGGFDEAGTLYWLRADHPDGHELIARDLVAHSLPWGAHSPAEVYDMVSLERRRRDLEHFETPPRPPATILELHVPTATPGGTIASLAALYRELGDKLRAGLPLTPEEEAFAGYEAIQPLPVDPTIERPAEVPTFSVTDVVDELAGTVGVLFRRPENLNWGYDNIVLASSAVNPSLLESKRPYELVALAEALHGMPEPMMLIYDLVYGHADNQGAEVLPSRFFSGPNMYGLDLNHQDPVVRAILLEMQRRRVNTGCDGLRVDGAQDFKFYNPMTGEVEHDDQFLQSMSDVPQEIGEHRRHPWMIFEDGRPWPREDWPTASSYRDVTELQPDAWQWGPLIFAHNTPMLEGFWRDKFWRVEEIARHGGRWITGCANHDTVRRGTQLPTDLAFNRELGDTLPDILDAAYDNDAIAAISCALLPGIPMDFINATTRTPWGFMRTTDDVYGVKVMAEERRFLEWQLDDGDWRDPRVFRRTRRHGFATRAALISFLDRLDAEIETSGYDLDEMSLALTPHCPGNMLAGREGLQRLAEDFMVDLHAVCVVGGGSGAALDAVRTAYHLELRRFRAARRWLADDCREGDAVRLRDAEQTVYHGLRVSSDGAQRVLTAANMAGPALDIEVAELFGELPDGADWTLSPAARREAGRLVLPDGAAAIAVVD